MPEYTFETPEPVDLRIRAATGVITITAADTTTSTVEVSAMDEDARELAEETLVDFDGRRLRVEMPEKRYFLGIKRRRIAITITVPAGSALTSKTASATISASGRYATVETRTASGRIALDQVDGDVEADCASGDVTINSGRAIKAHSASGTIKIGRATGDVEITCASADIRIGVAEASVRAKAASGDISVEDARSGTIALDVASGNLTVGVRSGVNVHLDLRSVSGKIRSELPVGDDAPEDGTALQIRARTTSGNVLVMPAPK